MGLYLAENDDTPENSVKSARMERKYMQKRLKSFDCLKGLACIGVVFIHFNFEGNLGLAVKAFCRFSVPVFFCISGFFLLLNGTIEDGKIVNKIRHIFKITVGAGVFYCMFTVIINSLQSNDWRAKEFAISRLTADRIVKFFITNDPFLYSHLWFLMALIYCYVFVLLFFEGNRRLSWIKVMAPLLLIFYTVLQEFGDVLGITRSVWIPGTENRVYFYNLFVFRALPAILFGMLMNKYRSDIEKIKISKVVLAALVVLGGGIAVFERFAVGETQFFLGSYLMVASLFVLAIKVPDWKIEGLEYLGRELSLYIYILHIAVGRSMDMVARWFGAQKTIGYLYGKPFLILAVSVLISVFILKGKSAAMKVLR